MLIKRISRHDIENVLDQAEIEYGQETINDTYAGRGMFGDTCLSVVFAGKYIQRDLCKFFLEMGVAVTEDLLQMDVDDADNLARNVSTDDLGMDTIVYFPGWKLND